MKLIKGQKVWLKPLNNAARYKTDPIELTVETIARKHFTVKEKKNRFFIETGLMDCGVYSPNGKIYETLEEIQDSALVEKVKKELRYGVYAVDIDKARKVAEILNLKL